MTTRTAARTVAATTLTMTAVLALAACGGGNSTSDAEADGGSSSSQEESAESGWTYQFDEVKVADQSDAEPTTAESDPFTVTLSDELAKAAPDGAKLAVKSYKVATKALPSGLCRADVTVDFAPDGKDALTKKDGADDAFYEMTGQSADKVVSEIPSDDQIPSEGGKYITKDASTFAVVDDCSEDTDDELIRLHFPFANKVDDWLAYANLIVAAGSQSGSEGSTTMIKGETRGVDVSAGGTWQKAE